MKYVYATLNWAFGILSLCVGLALIVVPLAGLPLLAMSLFLLPPARDFVHAKLGRALSGKARALILSVLLATSLVFLGQFAKEEAEKIAQKEQSAQAEKAQLKRIETLEHFNKNRERVIAEIRTALDSQEFGKATALLTEYRFVDDSTIHAIEAELQEKIAEAERAKRTTALLAELASAAESDLDKRMGLNKKLLDLHPGNEEYIKATDFYAHRIAEENEKTRIAKESENKRITEENEKKRITEERKKKLELQFSVWDGSHRTLEKLIKATMNDPRSYEHVETVYWDMEEHLIVRTTFRGKNIYGGVVPNWVKAKIDLDGNIIEVIETYP